MAKILPNDPPFGDYRVYGPYLGRKGSRQQRMVTLVGNPSTTMTYARYLLCVREARWLGADEEADHIDDNHLNDDPSNLQVLTPDANKRKSARGLTMVQLICPGCGDYFERERRQTHLVKGGKFPTSCSRKCAKMVQFSKGV